MSATVGGRRGAGNRAIHTSSCLSLTVTDRARFLRRGNRGGMPTLAIIGAGPRGVGILERIAENLAEYGTALSIHLIDPHPPGGGRIWRDAQSGLLKLNSMAADVTMFTDESSTIEGPIANGPSLIEWAEAVRTGAITGVEVDAEVRAELEALTGASFPTRRLQSAYLDWFYRRAAAALPASVPLHVHRATALGVEGGSGEVQRVRLDDGRELEADVVVYALGHTGRQPEPEHRELQRFAELNGAHYVAPDFTADTDLSGIRAGEDVIVRGMGLASVDLVVLLTQGRGGRFEGPRYIPSGQEPRLFLGSRRGVPYHSKISSTLAAPRAAARYFTAEIARRLESEHDSLRFSEDFWPLIAKELLWGYYSELFLGHPDRVRGGWDAFRERFDGLAWDSPELRALVEEHVPDPLDRLHLPDLDRPLAGLGFASREDAQVHIAEYIRRDLHLRSAPEHSATLALFYSLLYSLFDLGTVIDSPKWSARSRAVDLGQRWPGYFSYLASGPPAHRLEELLALAEAGVVVFLGADVEVRAEASGSFVASSPHVPGEQAARVLIDARLPATRVGASDNPALRSLVESGVGAEEYLEDADYSGTTGLLEVGRADGRVLDSSGRAHRNRFAVGPYTNAQFVGAFSRPRTNAVAFRENDRVARSVLALLQEGARVSEPA